jgi:hypothetical protein
MAQQTDITLKTYFETGDVPTEAQYIDLIDSKRNIQDEIPQADVTNLAPLTATISGSGSIIVPADALIQYILLIPSSNTFYNVGTTPGGGEYETGSLTAGTSYTLGVSGEHNTASKTIYFTGSGYEARIYIR